MRITRKEFADEERRMKKLRAQGKSERFVRSWLRGWRAVGARLKRNREKR